MADFLLNIVITGSIIMKKTLALMIVFLATQTFAAETCIITTISRISGDTKLDQFRFVFESTTVCGSKKATPRRTADDKVYNHETIFDAKNNIFDLEQRNVLLTIMESQDFELRLSQKLAKEPGDDDPLTRAIRYEMYFVKK